MTNDHDSDGNEDEDDQEHCLQLYLPARSSSVSSIARTPRASSSWGDDHDFDDDDEDVDVDDDFKYDDNCDDNLQDLLIVARLGTMMMMKMVKMISIKVMLKMISKTYR